MKKKLSYVLSLIVSMTIAASCSEECLEQTAMKAGANPNVRTPEEALRIANDAAHLLDKASTRATARTAGSLRSVQTVREFETRSVGTGFTSDTLMYIVNYDDEQGFALVSANPQTVDLLALTEDGSCYTFDNCEVEGFNDFMEMAKVYVRNPELVQDFIGPLKPLLPDTTYVYNIPPNLVSWGQNEPTGTYCPNGICGCVPTATAQICAYYGRPTSINLTYPNADLSVQPLVWDSIRLHRLTPPITEPNPSLYCTASENSHRALGRFCRQLGQMMNSSYGLTSTSTQKNSIIPCFTELGYTCGSWTDYSSECTRASIMANRKVYMAGQSSEGGHAWLVDGYMLRSYSSGGIPELGNNEIVSEYYNHVNWGWNGRYNGYFADGVFTVNNCFRRDASPYPLLNSLNISFYDVQYIVPVPNPGS